MFYLFTGLSAELYYVRDGFVNEYALHFTVPVAANIRDISFTWQSLAGRPVNIIAFSLFNNKSISEFSILHHPPIIAYPLPFAIHFIRNCPVSHITTVFMADMKTTHCAP